MAVTVLINGDKAEEAAVSQDSLLLASQQCGVARSMFAWVSTQQGPLHPQNTMFVSEGLE